MSIKLSDIAILNIKCFDYRGIISLISKYEAIKFLTAYIKMEKPIIKFGDTEIKKQKFYQYKRPISIRNIDINKTVVSNKVSLGKKGFKYFIGYREAKIRLLCIFLSKMSAYRTDLDKTKYMSFL